MEKRVNAFNWRVFADQERERQGVKKQEDGMRSIRSAAIVAKKRKENPGYGSLDPAGNNPRTMPKLKPPARSQKDRILDPTPGRSKIRRNPPGNL